MTDGMTEAEEMNADAEAAAEQLELTSEPAPAVNPAPTAEPEEPTAVVDEPAEEPTAVVDEPAEENKPPAQHLPSPPEPIMERPPENTALIEHIKRMQAAKDVSLLVMTTTKLVELGAVVVNQGSNGAIEFEIQERRFWAIPTNKVDVTLQLSEPTGFGFCPEMRLSKKATWKESELHITEFVLATMDIKKVDRPVEE